MLPSRPIDPRSSRIPTLILNVQYTIYKIQRAMPADTSTIVYILCYSRYTHIAHITAPVIQTPKFPYYIHRTLE